MNEVERLTDIKNIIKRLKPPNNQAKLELRKAKWREYMRKYRAENTSALTPYKLNARHHGSAKMKEYIFKKGR